MESQVAPTTKPKKIKRLAPKQRLTISNWLDPTSPTFGNLYQSCIKAGFSNSYALNISHLNPSWLSESIETTALNPEHIKQGIIKIATGVIDSRSVDDTRLKAYELLGKYAGLDQSNRGNTTVIVTPILGGRSVVTDEPVPTTSSEDSTIIDMV